MGCTSSTEAPQGSAQVPNEFSAIQIQQTSQEPPPIMQKSAGTGATKSVETPLDLRPQEPTSEISNLPQKQELRIEQKTLPEPKPKKESEPEAEPAPFIITAPPPDIESDDDGSELSRDSFEGNIVTNTPSPALAYSDDGVSSIASSSQGQGNHPIEKGVTKEKPVVAVISSKEEFIFEYERWQPFVQWGQTNPGHILPSDPGM
jgi:hypothetical protein